MIDVPQCEVCDALDVDMCANNRCSGCHKKWCAPIRRMDDEHDRRWPPGMQSMKARLKRSSKRRRVRALVIQGLNDAEACGYDKQDDVATFILTELEREFRMVSKT